MPPPPFETLPLGGAESLLKEQIRELLEETRARTRWLVESVDDDDLERVHNPIMSPLVWDLGHIAAFEDLWLCQRSGGLAPLRPELMEVYDATETPRSSRGTLPYLRRADALTFLETVRERALGALEDADVSPDAGGINRSAFAWEMVIQHEQQHNETMLQALGLAPAGVYSPDPTPLPPAPNAATEGMVRIAAGDAVLGAEDGSFSYDNERPCHAVKLPAFEIDRTPVTNGAYREFVEAGGYERREWWSDDGWAWLQRSGTTLPLFWTPNGGERRFDRLEPLDELAPVMHVSWYEADAFARSRGKRLPTEAEWEKAATGAPDGAGPRAYPWGDGPADVGHANLDQLGFAPAAAGAYPAGASAYGVLGLIGDAWEWTASDFGGYPGFQAYPYEEYSSIFFGSDYKVLRGGSWATRPRVIRPTFRNWDYPERRQLFCGFRCAVSV